jgi:hypothetical protein
MDTAELLDLGVVTELPLINSFFREMRRRDTQTRALQAWMQGLEPGAPVVLVTHQVNITALTGVFPASGEIVVVRMHAQGEPTVLGRIATD